MPRIFLASMDWRTTSSITPDSKLQWHGSARSPLYGRQDENLWTLASSSEHLWQQAYHDFEMGKDTQNCILVSRKHCRDLKRSHFSRRDSSPTAVFPTSSFHLCLFTDKILYTTQKEYYADHGGVFSGEGRTISCISFLVP